MLCGGADFHVVGSRILLEDFADFFKGRSGRLLLDRLDGVLVLQDIRIARKFLQQIIALRIFVIVIALILGVVNHHSVIATQRITVEG